MEATALLRPGLLADRVVALEAGSVLRTPLAALGATTAVLPLSDDEQHATALVQGAVAAHGAIDALVHDLRPAFGAGGHDHLRAALDSAWIMIRAVATTSFIPDEHGGRIVVIAPPSRDADPSSIGVRAAAENLARTLSIEWARHGITTVAITLGERTTNDEITALAAYLVSPAGAYFSGCKLALGDVA